MTPLVSGQSSQPARLQLLENNGSQVLLPRGHRRPLRIPGDYYYFFRSIRISAYLKVLDSLTEFSKINFESLYKNEF